MRPDDHRRRVWRRPRQCDDPAFIIARHTGPQLEVMQDNVRSHATRVSMNCLTAFKTLRCPFRSPYLSPVEHVWDMMGRRLHLPGNVNDLFRQLEQIWQDIPHETIRSYVTGRVVTGLVKMPGTHSGGGGGDKVVVMITGNRVDRVDTGVLHSGDGDKVLYGDKIGLGEG
ncbi:transposable element Tc1 transposase [Trichonephila clavipes]|nr:transposable element Tc1 transposase [Trichonephila clavipes]